MEPAHHWTHGKASKCSSFLGMLDLSALFGSPLLHSSAGAAKVCVKVQLPQGEVRDGCRPLRASEMLFCTFGNAP